MQLWHGRTPVSPVTATSADGNYSLRASDVIALVTLVAIIILSPMLFDLATALGIAH
jgi:hypothetical protein